MIGTNMEFVIILEQQWPLGRIQWWSVLAGGDYLSSLGCVDQGGTAIVRLALLVCVERYAWMDCG